LRELLRPGSRSVRGMPMMQRLYLAAGMPAAASRSISPQMPSISRCRSGSLPSRMCGLSAASIGRDELGVAVFESGFHIGRDIFRRFEVVFGFPRDRLDFGHGLLLQEARKLQHGFDIPDPSRSWPIGAGCTV